jgi:hypothetical protein
MASLWRWSRRHLQSKWCFLFFPVLLTSLLRPSFVSSDKRTQVLPHMPPERRKIVHDVSLSLLIFFVVLTYMRVARIYLPYGYPNG